MKKEGTNANTLVVIDMQNDFIDGSLGSKNACNIVPNVKLKIEDYIKEGRSVYFTMDTHFEDYLDTFEGKNLPVPHCIYNQYGWLIKDSLTDNDLISFDDTYKINPDTLKLEKFREANCHVVLKDTFGYTGWMNAADFISNADIKYTPVELKRGDGTIFSVTKYIGGSIEVVGLYTDVCLVSNVLLLRAMFPETEIIVDASCCAGTSKEKHIAAINVMESCQIVVVKKNISLLSYEED